MHDVYNFVAGPLVWVAFIVFFGGWLFRLIRMFSLINKKEPFIYSYMSWKYSFRSILRWMIPFATTNWRRKPVLTIVTFTFHICLIITPVFLMAHIILFEEAWNLSWWSLPDGWADVVTLIVIACCLYFLVRRLKSPEVQFVTYPSDYLILALVAAPFITGFLAYHQWIDYQLMLILHILAGEILLVAIPFTRLSHMIFSPFTRAYMGSEFGEVRNTRDW